MRSGAGRAQLAQGLVGAAGSRVLGPEVALAFWQFGAALGRPAAHRHHAGHQAGSIELAVVDVALAHHKHAVGRDDAVTQRRARAGGLGQQRRRLGGIGAERTCARWRFATRRARPPPGS